MKPVMIHVGKKAPKGFRELPGGIHLGKGIWILKIEPAEPKSASLEGKEGK
jgi:hypothetical protein